MAGLTRVRGASLTLVAIAALALPLSVAHAEPGHVVETDVMIPMRDGVLLAADIYRPAANGQLLSGSRPVLLTRTPYSKSRDSSRY